MRMCFNHMIYKGEKVIDPKNLKEQDTANVIIPYGADGAEVPYQKYRDVFKILCAMEDENAVYLLLGVENQIQCSLCNSSERIWFMIHWNMQRRCRKQRLLIKKRGRRKILKRRNQIPQSFFQAFTEKTGCFQL